MMSAARVRRIKFKSGGEIRPLYTKANDETQARFRRTVENMIGDIDVTGFAIVAWDRQFATTTDWVCEGTLPARLMPEFVQRVITSAQAQIAARSVVDDYFGLD